MRILFIAILLSSFLVHSQDLKTASTINEVTLYLQGARIERTASIELKKGTHEIKLSDLSPDIDEASINITDLDGMRLNGLSYSATALEKKETSNNIKALDAQIAEVKDEIGKLNALNSGLDQERLLLESNRSLNSKDTGLSLAQIKEFGTYYRTRFADIINERNANNEAITKASEQLNKLNTEKQKLNIKSHHTINTSLLDQL